MRPARAALALVAIGLSSLGDGPAGAQASNDSGVSRQWGLERIGAPAAWSVARGAGITIAIVDSGVAPTHPDLLDKLDGLVDCTGDGPCVVGTGADDAGHGTHVAGIAAATTGNGEGVAGVAPDARLVSVRALVNACDADGNDCQARGTESDVAEAIVWAADHGAAVINLSLGSITQQLLGPGFSDALEHAWSAGAIPVLAAGNEPLPIGSLVDVPAVLVAGTTRDDAHASYSGAVGNVRWSLAAPGGLADEEGTCASEAPNGILSTWLGDGYACVAGTSMAAPHVSGALAVLLSAGLTPQQAIDRLIETADDLGAPGRDSEFGSGRVNLARAVDGLAATSTGPGVVVGALTTSTTAGEAPPDTPVRNHPATSAPSIPEPTAAPSVGAGVTTPPVTFDSAADTSALPDPVEDRLPALPLTIAVLAVVAAAGGHTWRYLTTASWARRTPDR